LFIFTLFGRVSQSCHLMAMHWWTAFQGLFHFLEKLWINWLSCPVVRRRLASSRKHGSLSSKLGIFKIWCQWCAMCCIWRLHFRHWYSWCPRSSPTNPYAGTTYLQWVPSPYAPQLTHGLRQHAVTFGNERPSALKEVENRLWRMVLSIGSGQKLDSELAKFMSSISMLLSKVNKEFLEPHWFIGGMAPMT